MTRPAASEWSVLDLDSDPVPGDPQTYQEITRAYRNFADTAQNAHDLLAAGGHIDEGQGKAMDAFRNLLGQLPTRLDQMAQSYSQAVDAYNRYLPSLEEAQSMSLRALDQARQASQDQTSARAALNVAQSTLNTLKNNPDPTQRQNATSDASAAQNQLNDAQQGLDQAKSLLNQATALRDQAASQAIQALNDAASEAPQESIWQKIVAFFEAVVHFFSSTIMQWITTALDAIAAVASFIPGIGTLISTGLGLISSGIQIVGAAVSGNATALGLAVGGLALSFIPGGKLVGDLAKTTTGLVKDGVKAASSGLKDGGKTIGGKIGGKVGSGGQRSEGNGSCDGKGGDPVDVVSGQMITSVADVELPGLLPLTVQRAYASAFGAGRLFGPGWSSTLDQRLEVNSGSVWYVGDDAQVLHYPLPIRSGEKVLPVFGARWSLMWDEGSDTYRIEDPESGWVRHFGPNPLEADRRPITLVTDRNNHRLTYLYTDDGAPSAIEHSGGYQLAVDTITDPAGDRVAGLRLLDGANQGEGTVIVSYRYDRRGRLTGVVDSTGLPYRYEYDDANRITAWIDRNNFRYQYVYREDGRVIRGESQDGYLNATFDYDLDNRVTTVTNSLGHATRYHYDEYNHLTKVVDPLGNTEVTEFDRYHRLLSYTDPLGNATRYVHNEQGDPVRIEGPDGTWTSLDYDDRWRLPTRVSSPGGVVWQHMYSETGDLLTTTDPVGAVSACTQDERGHLVAVIEPDGQRWRFESNGVGRPLSITDPLGVATRYEYDAFGRLVATIESDGAVTRYGWTVEGKLTWQTGPDGIREELSYDPQGNLLEKRNVVGGVTRFEVGPFNLPVARTGADGTRYAFTYDTELRMVAVTNPAGQTWDYEYDPAGNLISEYDFSGRRITYRYDAAGRLVSRAEPSGQTVEYVYDAADRVITQRIDGEEATEFEYDSAGRMRRASNGSTELTYQRDLLGRLLTEEINGRVVRSEYDLQGRRTRRSTPTGVDSVWHYTTLHQPASLASTAGGLRFEYDSGGQETTRYLGAGAALTQAFDELGRLTEQGLWAHSPAQPPSPADAAAGYRSIQHRSYTYRPDGLVTAISDRLRGNRNYELTVTGRVTAITGQTWSERYTYDALGNLSAAQPGSPSDASGDHAVDGFLLRSAGRSSYEYDTSGRLTRVVRRTLSGQRRIWTFGWNGLNQLTAVTTPEGQRWHYTYDPFGRRISKQRFDENDDLIEEIAFVWDGTDLAEQQHTTVDGTNTWVTTTSWDYRGATGEPVAQTNRSWLADAPNEIIDTRFYAIVTDLVGSPTELVSSDGRIAWHQTTGLWGNQIAVSSQGGVHCPLRFPGQYHDPETGLHYNYFRYYDPQTARYVTPDPLGLPPAPNHYAYVANPLVTSDPLGLVHDRKTEYPSKFDKPTHDHMATNYTDEGVAQGQRPVYPNGKDIPRDQLSWRDPKGNPIPFYGTDKNGNQITNLTYEHGEPVVDHWNRVGYNQTRQQRGGWFNDSGDVVPMDRSKNSSGGAKMTSRYSDKAPGPNYSCT